MTSKTSPGYGARVYIGTYATSLFIQGCTVLQGAMLARLLGPHGRGEFAAIQLWPGIFAAIGLFGVNMALARRAGKTKDTAPLIKSAVILSCLTGIITAACCFVSLPFLIPEEMQEILPIAVLFLLFIPLNHMALNLLGIDQGAGNFKLLNITRAQIYPIFLAGLAAAWYFAENRLLWAVVALLIGNGAVVVVRLVLKWPQLWARTGYTSLRALVREGAPYQLTTMFTLLGEYIDQILLLWLLGPLELGIYVVARSAGSILASLPAALGIVSLSEAARLDRTNGFTPLAEMVRRGGIISVIIAGLLAPALPFLISLVYGEDFEEAAPIALVLLLGVIFAGLANIIEQSLRGHGRPMAGIFARIIGIIVLAILGTGASQLWGGLGIAAGYVFSQAMIFIVFLKICVVFFDNARMQDFIPQPSDFIFISTRINKLLKKGVRP